MRATGAYGVRMGTRDGYAAGVSLGHRGAWGDLLTRARGGAGWAYLFGFAGVLLSAVVRRGVRRFGETVAVVALSVVTVAGIVAAGEVHRDTPTPWTLTASDAGTLAIGKYESADRHVRRLRVTYTEAVGSRRVWVELNNGAAWVVGPCRYEDSTRCYWNARTMGNGYGDSFVVLARRVVYLPARMLPPRLQGFESFLDDRVSSRLAFPGGAR